VASPASPQTQRTAVIKTARDAMHKDASRIDEPAQDGGGAVRILPLTRRLRLE
jgi:hypothetical protein